MRHAVGGIFRKALMLYADLCRPVCREYGVQQGELNVLLFLAANPGKDTAADIHKDGGLKQSMVSVLVESLVQGGLLERQDVPGDRRKVKLVTTEKARPIIEAGQTVQEKFAACITEGIPREDLEVYDRVHAAMEQNILRCRERLKGAPN